MTQTAAPAQLTHEEVAEFRALWQYAAMLRESMERVVDALSHITGEEPDADGSLDSSVAWDVVHNHVELKDVLRRCNLSLPEGGGQV